MLAKDRLLIGTDRDGHGRSSLGDCDAGPLTARNQRLFVSRRDPSLASVTSVLTAPLARR